MAGGTRKRKRKNSKPSQKLTSSSAPKNGEHSEEMAVHQDIQIAVTAVSRTLINKTLLTTAIIQVAHIMTRYLIVLVFLHR